MSEGLGEAFRQIDELKAIIEQMPKTEDKSSEITALQTEIERLNGIIAQLQAQQNELANTPTMKKALSQSRLIKKLRGESND